MAVLAESPLIGKTDLMEAERLGKKPEEPASN